MAYKHRCRWCGTGVNRLDICYHCLEKLKVIKGSKLFGGKATYKTTWERFGTPSTYNNELGSETQKLIDFVNKSGTIHYGRVVAQERMR
jgi:hypothetical protein